MPVSRSRAVCWPNGQASGGPALAYRRRPSPRAGLRAPVLSAANVSMGLSGEQGRRLWLFMASGQSARDDPSAHPLMWLKVTPDRAGGFVTRELDAFGGVLQAPPFFRL